MDAELFGSAWIGFERGTIGPRGFRAVDRNTGEPLEPKFLETAEDDLDKAVRLADAAFRLYATQPSSQRAAFLAAIADELEAVRPALVSRAHLESALPEARLNGELTRTADQLRFFAAIAADGAWADLRTDHALTERTPPRPALRSSYHPLGPVAVFGASNFPLAFSVAGGDTASALAAGCPVIAKAHPSHPGTSELAGSAIIRAAQRTGQPEGVFSLVFESGYALGQSLVAHAGIRAVGFTGSRKGGLALMQVAQRRPDPIPVFAEMSSVNPVAVSPGKLEREPEMVAKGLAASLVLGVGQFCTNPGFVLLIGEAGQGAFCTALTEALAEVPACPMLTKTIGETYHAVTRELAGQPGVKTLLEPTSPGAPGAFAAKASTVLINPLLQEEIFGPATLIVLCEHWKEAESVLRSMVGQLTATLHLLDYEAEAAKDLLWEMQQIAGRIVINQFPTGVEVCDSMVHGGPFPATSDGRSTSVGGRAILRWVRPICYQNFPE